MIALIALLFVGSTFVVVGAINTDYNMSLGYKIKNRDILLITIGIIMAIISIISIIY